MKTHVLCLMFALASVASAVGATVDEVRALIGTGCPVTVDKRFPVKDVQAIVSAGRGKITVVCAGFTAADAKAFLGGGATIVVDSSIPAAEILALARQGRNRVRLETGTLSGDVLKQAQAFGAIPLATTGGSSTAEKMKTLSGGGQCVADSSLPVRDIANLIAAGRSRVHVVATGIAPGELRGFVQAGALVWLDTSFRPADIALLARAGRDRVIVRAGGFGQADLMTFAQAHAHIVFAFDRAHARVSTFDQMFGKN